MSTPGVDYERQGLAVTEYRPDGPWDHTLVLLSSLGVSRRSWSVPGRLLGRSYRCLAVDLPGHGTSPPPEHFLTIPDLAEAIGGLLDDLGARDVAVIGNSMGATIGTALADQRADLVSALAHIGSAVWETEAQRRAWLHSRSGIFCAEDGTVREMTRDFVEAIFGRYDPAWHQMLGEDQQRSGARLGWAMWALYAYDTAAALERLRMPVLAVFGERDPYRNVSLPVLRRHLRALDEVIVPDGSHLLPVDRGPELTTHIRDWLTAPGSGGSARCPTTVTKEMA
ncbi:MAG TPA: alpha/beta fold hydrolase [Pseudonocardia sp.]|jgi:3-oxoadipate enol-lactonase/4-carboxymuconolactone decarboxylase